MAICRWVTTQGRISFLSNDFWLRYGPCTCIWCSNFKFSGLFLDVLWYIDLIFGMRLYLDVFKLEFRSGRMIFSPLPTKSKGTLGLHSVRLSGCPSVQQISFPHFFSSCLQMLIWYLVYCFTMISYRSSSNFVLVRGSFAELWPLDFENSRK